MKKILLAYTITLVGIFVILSVVDQKGDYNAEKEIWKINAEFTKHTRDPKVVPTGAYEDIRKKYENFIKNYANSRLVPLAELHVGHTDMAMKNYDQAKEYFENFIKKYHDAPLLAVQAAVEITRIYALEESEAGILKSYNRIMRDFPETEIGLQTPLLIVDFYKNTGKNALMQKALDDAERHYKAMINKHPSAPVEFRAMQMLANTYIAKKLFSEAVDTLGSILLKFPDPKTLTPRVMDNLVKAINVVAIIQLKNFDKPIEIYSEFLKKYPDHIYSKHLKTLIERLEFLKKQDVGVILKKNE